MGLSGMQKFVAAIRILAYGCAADAVDEYVRIAESTALQRLESFSIAVNAKFGAEYLRCPTAQDIRRLLSIGEKRGFPGILGSIDCTKWQWKNCPVAFHGQYSGKEGVPTVILEAIADHNLWLWHVFFGVPGAANDINVLETSYLLNNIANGSYPPLIEYFVGRVRRNIPYWPADGLYPKWPVFLHSPRKKNSLAKLRKQQGKM
jgi:Plant transposon protein